MHAATDALASPLHLALRPASAHVEIATLLLRHGAPPAARLRDGTTPLMRAHEVLGLVRTLLEHAAARAAGGVRAGGAGGGRGAGSVGRGGAAAPPGLPGAVAEREDGGVGEGGGTCGDEWGGGCGVEEG